VTVTRIALVAVGVLVLAGCSQGGATEVDQDHRTSGHPAHQQLVQQRLDVRDGARALLVALEDHLGGTTSHSSGQYRGCESTFNDQYRSFQYLAQGRVDVPGATSPADLQRTLERAGFSGVEESSGPGGRQSLEGRSGGVRAVLTVYDQQPYVLVDASGSCVDVPEEQRDEWLAKDEPSPDLR
jgi:hypothetical protein